MIARVGENHPNLNTFRNKLKLSQRKLKKKLNNADLLLQTLKDINEKIYVILNWEGGGGLLVSIDFFSLFHKCYNIHPSMYSYC